MSNFLYKAYFVLNSEFIFFQAVFLVVKLCLEPLHHDSLKQHKTRSWIHCPSLTVSSFSIYFFFLNQKVHPEDREILSILKSLILQSVWSLYSSSISKCELKLFAMDTCSNILVKLGFSSSSEWHDRCCVALLFNDTIWSAPGSRRS